MKLTTILTAAALLLPLPTMAQEVITLDQILGIPTQTSTQQPQSYEGDLYPHREGRRHKAVQNRYVSGQFHLDGSSIQSSVTQYAHAYGVPAALAHGVVRVESGYNCGARHGGIMQVLAPTARSMGVTGSLNSCHNSLTAGMRYLRKAYEQSGGNLCAAATAYNTGSMGTRRCSAYGRRVLARLAQYE